MAKTKKYRNFFVISKYYSYLCIRFCACGEIGRRARLRIWCFATCRFESYQAHIRGSLTI